MNQLGILVGWFLLLCHLSANASPVIIAHRAASGYLPEHTLEAVAMAHAWNVDYIEPDVVMTKDDHLVVLHDIHIDTVTNVREVFPDRVRDDKRFYAIDFTLAELKTLKVSERFDPRNDQPVFKKRFPLRKSNFKIASFREWLELLQGLNKSTGRNIGVYVEFKSPAFHEKAGKDISAKLISDLHEYGYKEKDSGAIVQCFDPRYLKKLKNEMKVKLPLVQLIASNKWGESDTDYDAMMTEKGIEKVAEYADGIGPWINFVVLPKKKFKPQNITPLVRWAKKSKLLVHAYTARADKLPPYASSIEELFRILFEEAKIDGVFTDFGDLGVQYRDAR